MTIPPKLGRAAFGFFLLPFSLMIYLHGLSADSFLRDFVMALAGPVLLAMTFYHQ